MDKKLVVFPNDSLLDYYNKGEIKDRYFNPKNWFEQIDVISLFDTEIEANKVLKLAGNASFRIHKVGKANLSNYKSFEEKVISLISEIQPCIIRSFNPRIQGWLATKASKKLEIPVVVSLHTNYEQQKQLAKDQGNYLKFLKLRYSANKLEKFVLQNCDSVICVYEFIVPYAQKMGAQNIEIIYNKVDLENFSPSITKHFESEKPTIISVGRLIEQKNRKNLIRAIKELDVNLLIIGDGPQYDELIQLINSLELQEKTTIIKKVPNDELGKYYTSSEIFALPMENLDGIPIPFLEAMACGLPVVSTKHSKEYSEITDEAVVFVDNDPKSFENAFKKIFSNLDYKKKLVEKSLEIVKKIGGNEMEEKELLLYKKLIK